MLSWQVTPGNNIQKVQGKDNLYMIVIDQFISAMNISLIFI